MTSEATGMAVDQAQGVVSNVPGKGTSVGRDLLDPGEEHLRGVGVSTC